jgi:ureidoglycolate lyase
LQVRVEPLTAQAFKPFGQVTDMASGERRNHIAGAFERTAEAVEPRLWVATVLKTVELPLVLQSLERHPYSAQSFMPVNGCPYIVVVCHAEGSGQPDLSTLQAFSASSTQGVTYARNVWHHGLSVLKAPAQFVVCMSFTGEGGDDIFVPLDIPVRLVANGAVHG